MEYSKDNIDVEMCKKYDIILNTLKKYRDKGKGVSPGRVKNETGIVEAHKILSHLESNGFIISYPESVTGLEYIMTASGLSLFHKNGGYYQFITDALAEDEAVKEKKALEMKKLIHDVKISKWQFRFFVAGAASGILSLVWTILKQFVFNT